jgi:hypothetical protein
MKRLARRFFFRKKANLVDQRISNEALVAAKFTARRTKRIAPT